MVEALSGGPECNGKRRGLLEHGSFDGQAWLTPAGVPILGGSCVVLNGLISPLIWVISIVTL